MLAKTLTPHRYREVSNTTIFCRHREEELKRQRPYRHTTKATRLLRYARKDAYPSPLSRSFKHHDRLPSSRGAAVAIQCHWSLLHLDDSHSQKKLHKLTIRWLTAW